MNDGVMWGIVYIIYICLIAPYYLIQSFKTKVSDSEEKQVTVIFLSWISGLLLIMFLHYIDFNPIASYFVSTLLAVGAYFVIKKFKALL